MQVVVTPGSVVNYHDDKDEPKEFGEGEKLELEGDQLEALLQSGAVEEVKSKKSKSSKKES